MSEHKRLREAVEKEANRTMSTPSDFRWLSQFVFERTHQSLSPSTLMRFWGYMASTAPGKVTLNILSRTLGYTGYDEFVAHNPEHDDVPEMPDSPLEIKAKHQSLVDEMQAIVDEMVANREIRLEQQFLRLIDPRDDDDPTDQWCVLRGAEGNNPYIGYAPVTNEEWKLFQTDFTYQTGQERYPVCNITYDEATAYCQWLSDNDPKHIYRLPTEEDWILGAGHMPKDVRMNSDHVETGLTSVDAYNQTTGACGGIDFWDNCWEWTSTQTATGQYIVKGGAWDTSRDSCRSEYSDDSRDGSQGYANVGIRVVKVDR